MTEVLILEAVLSFFNLVPHAQSQFLLQPPSSHICLQSSYYTICLHPQFQSLTRVVIKYYLSFCLALLEAIVLVGGHLLSFRGTLHPKSLKEIVLEVKDSCWFFFLYVIPKV